MLLVVSEDMSLSVRNNLCVKHDGAGDHNGEYLRPCWNATYTPGRTELPWVENLTPGAVSR